MLETMKQSQRLSFEGISIRPAAALDMTKVTAAMRNGEFPNRGALVRGAEVEFIYVTQVELICLAYSVRREQVNGPDWIAGQRFDIYAKSPEGSSEKDLPQILQALLEDRFRLVLHRESRERPGLALVVAEDGPR